MKYSVKKERLIEDLKWLEEKNNALNDYGLLVRHLLNEVDELKQLLIQRVSQRSEPLIDIHGYHGDLNGSCLTCGLPEECHEL